MKKTARRRRVTVDKSLVEKRRRPKRKQRRSRKRKKTRVGFAFLREVRLFMLILVGILLFGVMTFNVLFSVKRVTGYGMMPTLQDKDVLILKRRPQEIARFDLVLIDNGRAGDFLRVIGLPGESIEVKDDQLFVDKQPLDEKFIIEKINDKQVKGQQYTADFTLFELSETSKVPADSYFVLGDNRPYTTDSRQFGFISKEKIRGRVQIRFWPLDIARKF